MYHDQGLPVLKHAGFGQAVNVTLGLSFVRTSVDHGTALDLAGTGRAEHSSLVSALTLARELARASPVEAPPRPARDHEPHPFPGNPHRRLARDTPASDSDSTFFTIKP